MNFRIITNNMKNAPSHLHHLKSNQQEKKNILIDENKNFRLL